MIRGQVTLEVQVRCCGECPYHRSLGGLHSCNHPEVTGKTVAINLVESQLWQGFPNHCPEMR